jgi:hypothetical protein
MQTLTTRCQTIIASAKMSVAWRYIVTDASGTYYFWSTRAIDADTSVMAPYLEGGVEFVPGLHGYNEEHYWAYEAKIVNRPKITLRETGKNSNIIAPNDIAIEVANPNNALTHSDFKGGRVWVALSMNDGSGEQVIRRWRFRIKKTEPNYQTFTLTCEDYLQAYLRGDYPNTRLVRDIFPADDADIDDNVCVPAPYGTAYIPLRSDYIGGAIAYTASTISFTASANGATCKISDSANGLSVFEKYRYITITGGSDQNGTYLVSSVAPDGSQIELSKDAGITTEAAGDSVTLTMGSRYYILGEYSADYTFTISECRSPKQWGLKSSQPWQSGSYDFNQYTKADPDATDWRVFQPIIADADSDNVADSPGLWAAGGYFYDMPTKFTRSDTASVTDPSDITQRTLWDFGCSQLYLNVDSFGAAKTAFASWGLTWNGAFWYKEPRQKVLSRLLNMCHAHLISGDQIGLNVLSKTSRATLTKADIIKAKKKPGQGALSFGKGSFRYQDVSYDYYSDCGYVAYVKSGEPADKLLKILVPAKGSTRTKISGDILELPFIDDSQEAQKLGTLKYQRELLREADVSFQTGPKHADKDPGDVLTVNHADYGGSYDIIIEQMTFEHDGSIEISGYKLSQALDDWADLSPTAVTVYSDDSLNYWEPVLGGPLSDQDLGRRAFDVLGRPFLVVGPNANQGDYTDIQDAVNALAESRHNGIYILNGTYTLSGPIYIPDRSIEIQGENRGAVIIRNAAGELAFHIYDYNSELLFANFTIDSQNTSGNNTLIEMKPSSGTMTGKAIFKNLIFDLWAGGTPPPGAGDTGLYLRGSSGLGTVETCEFNSGSYGVLGYDWENLIISKNKLTGPTGYGFHITYCDDLRLEGNIVKDFLYDGAFIGGAIYRVSIVNNTFIADPDDVQVGRLVGIDLSSVNGVIKGNTITIASARTTSTLYGILASIGGNSIIALNSILIDAETTSWIYGVYASYLHDGQLSNNTIKMDDSDTSNNHYGFYLISVGAYGSSRNVIQGNQIDMVNNAAADIGISMDANSGNNQGGDNITCNVGTSISDAGTGNSVTAKDV